jgi:hypothetical protein
VVRAWCESIPAGAPSAEVEGAADRLLASLTPADTGRRHPGRAEVRGVGEGRHLLTPVLERVGSQRQDHELARALAARGMTPTPDIAVHPGRRRELARDAGLGFG